jgi:hypothetical protein
VVCNGVQQRMQAIQSMHNASFLTYSYVLADSSSQVQQVYNAAFQQSVHHDAGKWHEAKVKNPDSQFAYPMPIYGFQALSERSKQQQSHLNNLVAAADNAKTQVNNLKAHTERTVLTELENCEKRNNQLSIQLAKLMLSIELFGLQNCKASVDFNRHRNLMEQLETVSSGLSQLQSKIQQIKGGQKAVHDASVSIGASVGPDPNFKTLKESVNAKLDSVYNAVLDRCRAASAQALHERLNSRSQDYVAELKRQYIAGDAAHVDSPIKFRTMNAYEISICRILTGVSQNIFGSVMEVSKLTAHPQILADLWQVCAHICGSSLPLPNFLRSSVEFLESKFASDITGSSSGYGRVSTITEKKTMLYSYCRQRVSIRSGDISWIWFAVFCAFRAGWSSTLHEISQEKGSLVEGLELVCTILAGLIEGHPENVDMTKLNSFIESPVARARPEEEINHAYKVIVVTICKGEFESLKIAQQLPDCNAFDWIWYGLRQVIASSDVIGGLCELRRKIESLPLNYFSGEPQARQLYPTLSDAGLSIPRSGGQKVVIRSAHSEQTKSASQLALMHFLTLDFDSGIKTALKTPTEPFDVNDPFHRSALFISMCLDKYGVLSAIESSGLKGSFDASGIVIEAALTVAVVQERNMYASAVSSVTSKAVLQQLGALDKRRESTTNTSAIAGR